MTRAAWRHPAARPAAGVVIVLGLLALLGPGPFLSGLRRIDGWALLSATAATAVATTACVVRWRLVATRLGVRVGLGDGVRAYYRSQFLNATLPGGVLGDVERGVRRGRGVHDLGLGLRSVAWERTAGQFVQIVVALVVLAALPSPLTSPLRAATARAVAPSGAPPVGLMVAAAVAVLVVAVVLAVRRVRVVSTLRRDVRALATPRVLLGVVLTSAVAVAAHGAVFLVACRAAGVDAPLGTLLPIAVVVLLSAAVPLSAAGWGPREGAAAWAFAATGLGAAQGLTVSVVVGVLSLVATLPGALVLIADRAVPVAELRPAAAPAPGLP